MAIQAQKKSKYGELFSMIEESFGTKIGTLLQLGVISHKKASLERTYCLNLAISNLFSSKSGDLVPLLPNKILC
jgi:hypothetical protein